MIRYRSVIDKDLQIEEPDTEEGRARLAERVAQAENPDDPAYFMGRAEFYDPDAPAETAQEAEEAAP
ncbi:MAG: hypothetical protein M0R37_15400 [Bacteroidales bacterium]|nr:hypothetical protein [Bacteroidales bacterium]